MLKNYCRRTFLRDCTIELQNYNGDNAEEVQKLSALFYGIELIFHLAEILNLHQDRRLSLSN